jgi:hypothetical protein
VKRRGDGDEDEDEDVIRRWKLTLPSTSLPPSFVRVGHFNEAPAAETFGSI